MMDKNQTKTEDLDLTQKSLRDALQRASSGLRYGSVEVVVHDGRIVQVVRTERIRVAEPPAR